MGCYSVLAVADWRIMARFRSITLGGSVRMVASGVRRLVQELGRCYAAHIACPGFCGRNREDLLIGQEKQMECLKGLELIISFEYIEMRGSRPVVHVSDKRCRHVMVPRWWTGQRAPGVTIHN